MTSPLASALNKRKGRSQATAVPVAINFDSEPLLLVAEEQPRPATEIVDGMRVRDFEMRHVNPGEIGHRAAPPPADEDYSEAAFRTLLSRVAKGCNYINEHINDEQGHAQLGLLVELAEDLGVMARLHMARKVLND